MEGDLGRRMAASFRWAFEEDIARVVLTGTDIPDLDAELVTKAFKLLKSKPAVIGPATDGGYYLLGLQYPGADIFGSIAWSTSQVLKQTVAQLEAMDLPLAYLPELMDVDTIGAYARWRERKRGH